MPGRQSARHDPVGGVPPVAGLSRQFATLAARWRENTEDVSLVALVASNVDYLRIIALGGRVVPLILQDLQERGGYWYPALEALTGASPATPEERESRAGMRQAWLRWGRERGLVA
jgi:hypothetical protein